MEVCGALKGTAPAIAEFLTVERYSVIKAAIIGNCMGIHFPRASPAVTGKSEKKKKEIVQPRSAVSWEQINAIGLYFVTSYVRHGDHPNAVVEFVYPHYPKSKKSNIASPKLVLRALKPIAIGEEITISHVPPTPPAADLELDNVDLVVGEDVVGK